MKWDHHHYNAMSCRQIVLLSLLCVCFFSNVLSLYINNTSHCSWEKEKPEQFFSLSLSLFSCLPLLLLLFLITDRFNKNLRILEKPGRIRMARQIEVKRMMRIYSISSSISPIGMMYAWMNCRRCRRRHRHCCWLGIQRPIFRVITPSGLKSNH